MYQRRLGRQYPEDALQKALVDYLDLALPDDAMYFAVPNGGKRLAREAARLKSLGVLAGIPDLCIIWRGTVIFLELKAPKRGSLTTVQRDVHHRLLFCGVPVWTIRKVEQAEYLLRGAGMPLQATFAQQLKRVWNDHIARQQTAA
jgi:hypothetical protein